MSRLFHGCCSQKQVNTDRWQGAPRCLAISGHSLFPGVTIRAPRCGMFQPKDGKHDKTTTTKFTIMLRQQESNSGGTNGDWHVEISTPDGAHLKPAATLVELCTADGQIGVMPGHERLVTVLDVGELVIHNGPQRDVYLLGGGFARVLPGRLSVLAFSLERGTDGTALEKCRARRDELMDDGEKEESFHQVDELTALPK